MVWRPASLRVRLMVLIGLAIFLAALMQGGLAYRNALQEADALFDYQMRQTALALRAGLPVNARATPLLQPLNEENHDFIVQVWSNEGLRVFESVWGAVLPQIAVLGFADVAARGTTYRVFSLRTPAQVIQVAQDVRVRSRMARGLAWQTIWPIALLAPVLALAVWWLVGRSLEPVQRVRRELAQRHATQLAPVSEAALPQEVLPLVQELNLLFGRVQQAFESQQHFVADAAHALRSPLQALTLQLKGLQRASDEAGRQAALQRLAGGIERTTQLVDQLLQLAREEAQQAPVTSNGHQTGSVDSWVDIAPLVAMQIAEMAPAAHAKGIDIGRVEGSAEMAYVCGKVTSLQVLLRNLLDNAVKYIPSGGQVDVRLAVVDHGVELRVEDSGPGIPEVQRARALERFVRAPEMTISEVQGSGLGLSIVHAIARRQGAQVVLETSTTLGGLCVRVSWPVSEALAPASAQRGDSV